VTLETVQAAIEAFRAGRMVILVDDEDRENEGDLCLAAEKVTPEAINFMAKWGRGLICLALTDERIRRLELPPMVAENTSTFGTAFTVSIEARRGVTTGISAADRAVTILTAMRDDCRPDDLVRPGHVFPLRAQPGGVLVRTGQTEGVVDLARLAGLSPAGVICEVMNDDGTMARLPELKSFAAAHDLLVLSIAELIEYRLRTETLVKRLTAKTVVHPQWGELTLIAYATTVDAHQHLAVVKGDLLGEPAPLVRVHAGYPLTSVLDDLVSNERQILYAVMSKLVSEGRGAVVFIDRGTPDMPLDRRLATLGDNHEPDPHVQGSFREIGVGSQILRDLGLSKLRLLSNNARRFAGIEAYGLHVESVVALNVPKLTPLPDKPLQVISGGVAKGL